MVNVVNSGIAWTGEDFTKSLNRLDVESRPSPNADMPIKPPA